MKEFTQKTELDKVTLADEGEVQGTKGAGGKQVNRKTWDDPCAVYTVTLNGTDKSYVGITQQFPVRKRWEQERYRAKKGDGGYFYSALRTHGPESFDWQIISICENRYDACRAEKTWIAAGWSTYNTTEGGEGCLGYKHTKEAKRKIGDSHKGKIVSEETRKKLSASATGQKRIFSEEHIANLAAANKRNGATRNKEVSKETREKLSKVMANRIIRPETIEKQKQKLIGVKHSPERIAKRVATRATKKEEKLLRQAMGPPIKEVVLDG